jgi:subtilisin family serine protease
MSELKTSAARVWIAGAALAGMGLLGTGAAAADGDDAGGAHKAKARNRAYIVQMAEPPVTAYSGGIAGLAATKPGRGQKIDPNAPAVRNYLSHLRGRHDTALGAAGGGRKLYSYGYVFNGFAAELSAAQADKLARTPGVLAVSKDEARLLDTATTPTFLGLTGSGGFWNSTGATGENVIIGVVDGGIWPEHPSFSDRTGGNGNGSQTGKLSYQQIPGWHGKCTPGPAFNASHCNQKLIGAQYFVEGRLASSTPIPPYEYLSPRDYSGHGTHTASTAGGNAGIAATGQSAVFGTISGIAPRARIAVYKSCFYDEAQANGSCFSSDSVAAIDQAVADGVDVINFSVGGSRTNFRDAVEIAFLFAADAGVFVATSAGNSGPTVSTVAHPGPWVTTVAAGTHNRDGVGSTTLGSGDVFNGSSYANALGATPLIDAAAAALPGANPAAAELCLSGADNLVNGTPTPVLDPAKVTGKVVLCKRGSNALVNKSGAVAAAGGAGAIIYNDPAGATNTLALLHAVPAVHVVAASGLAIKSYIASAGAQASASIAKATIVLNAPAPITASFSSRGPLLAGGGDLLKPDLIAPGQDVLAAVAPPGNSGRLFDLYSGTSMASPHVAGLAALFKQLQPGWSPMAIKSALMTSAGDVLDGPNTNPLVIFRQGAGHVQPNAAINPGLVFDSNFGDWLGFLCGTQLPTSFCADAGVPVLDPSDFNGASIAIGDLTGTQTVKRRVTNVSGNPATFSPSVSGLAGITVAVNPPQVTLGAGETKAIEVTFTRTAAALNAYTGGQLTFSNGTSNVRMPVVVRPVALAAPVEVNGSYSVKFGYDGPFTATARGLIAPAVNAGTVGQDPDQTFVQADSAGTVAIPVVIPAGTTFTRFALFDADVTAGTDLDVYVYQGTTLVGSSANATSAEEVNFTFATPSASPIALTVYVHGFAVSGGSTPFKLHAWQLGTAAAGNMTVTPSTATASTAGTATITLGFSGLTPGTKYLGSVAYGGAAGMPAPTIVRVDP